VLPVVTSGLRAFRHCRFSAFESVLEIFVLIVLMNCAAFRGYFYIVFDEQRPLMTLC
jgi:hypothetical protein